MNTQLRRIQPRERGFAIVSNEILKDTRMSGEARHLLALLLSYSDKWVFRETHLRRLCGTIDENGKEKPVGRAKWSRMTGELKDLGYLEISRTRGERGHFTGWTWFIKEEPNRTSETRHSVNPKDGEPDNIGKNNSKKDQLEEPPKPPEGEWVEIFETLWRAVSSVTPTRHKGRSSKKQSKAAFKAIVTRKKDPIPAGRVAHAVLHFYDSEGQRKEDRKYFKGLQGVLRQELFENFLADGPFRQETHEEAVESAWKRKAEFVNKTRSWPQVGEPPSSMPEEYRLLVDRELWESLGWD